MNRICPWCGREREEEKEIKEINTKNDALEFFRSGKKQIVLITIDWREYELRDSARQVTGRNWKIMTKRNISTP